MALSIFLIAGNSELYFTMQPNNYLSTHIVLEFFSMAVSYAIVMQSWLTYPHTQARKSIYLGAAFIVVGSFDLLHTLSFKGMPFFLTASSVAKATWFWIAARITEAVALAWILMRRNERKACNRAVLYWGAVAYFLVFAYLIIYWESYLPTLVVEGQGVTDLKIALEYFVSVLHLVTAGILLHRYQQKPETSERYLIVALFFLLLGELIFTLYRNVYDFYNFLGHLYKVFGYYYLAKSLYFVSVEEPFARERAALQRLEDLVEVRTTELRVTNGQLLAKNQELEAFCYSVSHDLRTPLRSIDGFSQLLLEDYQQSLDDTGQDYLHRVRSASQRMGHLIDDLLDLSKVTRQQLKQEEVNLSDLAMGILQELQEGVPQRRVVLNITPDLTTWGDRRLLCIALTNLLANAWKFTAHTAAPQIEFGCCQRKGQLVYYIRDNGAGFEMAYLHKLFHPFQRLHAIDEFQGTGIGLAIVKRIIDRHNGDIWAEGEVGKGATFYFGLGIEE